MDYVFVKGALTHDSVQRQRGTGRKDGDCGEFCCLQFSTAPQDIATHPRACVRHSVTAGGWIRREHSGTHHHYYCTVQSHTLVIHYTRGIAVDLTSV